MKYFCREYIICFSFAIFLFLISWTQIADYDFWWHINLGKQVVSQRNVNMVDSFSFTFFGENQFNSEWIADVAIYLMYSFGGVILVDAFKFIILLLSFYFLYQAAIVFLGERRDAVLSIAISFVVVALALRFRLFVRPFLFSYLFVCFDLWLLAAYLESRNTKNLFYVLFLQLIWVNSSKGFFYGPLLVLLWIVSDYLKRHIDFRLCALFVLLILSSALNPEGFSVYSILFDYIAEPASAVGQGFVAGEFQPLTRELLWGSGFGYTWPFQVLFLLGFFYLLSSRGRRDWRAWLLFVVFLLPAIKSVRMIDFFSLVSVFFVVPAVSIFVEHIRANYEKSVNVITLAFPIMIIIIGMVAVLTSTSFAFGAKIKDGKVPSGAVDFLKKNGVAGRVFNSYPFGGYIAWAAPDMQIYIDGRANQLYTEEALNKYLKMISSSADFEEEQKKWNFEIAILEYDVVSDGRHYPKHISGNNAWALVYWDNDFVVYLKKNSKFEQIIKTHSYMISRPNFYNFLYLVDNGSQSDMNRLLEMARHDISLNANNQESRIAYVNLMDLAGYAKYSGEILNELNTCVSIKPDLGIEYILRGVVLKRQGRLVEARNDVRRALELNPNSEYAQSLARSLGVN